MPIVRIEHTVSDFEKWRELFDSDPVDRKGSGVRRYQILRGQHDPNYVTIDLQFDETDEAETFVQRIEQLWEGPAKDELLGPRARILDSVDVRELSR